MSYCACSAKVCQTIKYTSVVIALRACDQSERCKGMCMQDMASELPVIKCYIFSKLKKKKNMETMNK